MSEVNVTCLVNDEVDPFVLSHSRAEAGEANKFSDAVALATGRECEGFDVDDAKAWAAEFGAWECSEIAAWSADETLALVLQYAAGDLRELQALAPGDGLGDIDWTEAGTCGSSLFVSGDQLYVYIGS